MIFMISYTPSRRWGRRPGILDILAHGPDGRELDFSHEISKMLETEKHEAHSVFSYRHKDGARVAF